MVLKKVAELPSVDPQQRVGASWDTAEATTDGDATMEMLIGAVFTQAVHRMVASFEDRADEIYGSSAADEASGQLAPDHITK